MPGDRSPADPPGDPADALTAALVRACRVLAAAGYTDDAARIAAQAWLSLRTTRPALALKLDGAMHYVARLEQQQERRAAAAGATNHLHQNIAKEACA